MPKLAGSLQETQESSVTLRKVLPAYLGEAASSAPTDETQAGPKGIVPSLLIGNWPLTKWKGTRVFTLRLSRCFIECTHSAASGPSFMWSITSLLKISLARMFSSPT